MTGTDSNREVASRNDFVEVIVPLPLPATFTYHLPADMRGQVGVGHRVIVPFGRKKFYTAIVTGFANIPPEGMEVKEVAMVLDTEPIVRHPQLKLWQWIADYYLSDIGDVYKAALPAGLKIESDTFIEVNPDYDFAAEPLGDLLEVEIHQLLDHEKAMSVKMIADRIDKRGVAAAVNRLVDRGVLIISEKLVERYRPKFEQYVRPLFSRDEVATAFEKVKGARKQETMLLGLLELSGYGRGESGEVRRAALLERTGCRQPSCRRWKRRDWLRCLKRR